MCIDGMENVRVMGNSLCGGVDSGVPKAVKIALYPSLTEVSLSKMSKLEEWVKTVMGRGANGQRVFPKLESLKIEEFSMLRKIPNCSFPCLKKLEIRDMESSMILESVSTNSLNNGQQVEGNQGYVQIYGL
ncbi:hypothetical protein AG4045_002781 [Apium graveolens]|uniref:Uncharacterized protein n=1 Tax=Apium graveolens TaxID=4045 RepID=A0A6L5B9Z5_APIGR|nr:hypothetical protein AG4045_002781 [Apium graveolens]